MSYLKYALAFFCFLPFAVQTKVHLTEQIDNNEVFDVYWAGFAFLGDFNQRETRYPYSSQISKEKNNGQSVIDVGIGKALQDFNNPNINLKTELSTKPGAIAMAVGLSYEDAYTVKFGSNEYKTTYDLALNIILFDFAEKKIIAVHPLRLFYLDASDSKPSADKNKNIFNKLYSGQLELNIFNEIVKKLNALSLRKAYGNYIGIRSINFKGSTQDLIPDSLLQNNSIETQTAQEFEALLSKNTFVPVVPYTKGELIGGRMPARFSDGSAYNLKLPEKDYLIDLDIRKFKKQEKGSYFNYKSIITVRASTQLGEKVNLKLSRSMWNLKSGSGSGEKDQDWSLYELSLSSLLNEFTKQLATSTPKWTKKHSASKDAESQMDNLRDLLRKSQ